MQPRFIDAVGVELEGGWSEPIRGLKHDGSVNIQNSDAEHIGEIASNPFRDMKELVKFMRRCHPDFVNETCGLHVHYSFRRRSFYALLMEKDFQAYFIEQMEAWVAKVHPSGGDHNRLMSRLRGRNSYCKKEWLALQQVTEHQRGGSRYTHWNYAFHVHGTAECRVLPMFQNPEHSIGAVRYLTTVVNKWLRIQVRQDAPEISEPINTSDLPALMAEETHSEIHELKDFGKPETLTEDIICA